MSEEQSNKKKKGLLLGRQFNESERQRIREEQGQTPYNPTHKPITEASQEEEDQKKKDR